MRVAPVFLAFSLAACGGGYQSTLPATAPPPTISGGDNVPSNQIVIYRRAEIGVTANLVASPAILLDGRTIGTCRIAQPIVIRVPEGSWTITALTANGEVSQEVIVGEGDRANLRCGTSTASPDIPVPTLTSVDTEIAQQEAGL